MEISRECIQYETNTILVATKKVKNTSLDKRGACPYLTPSRCMFHKLKWLPIIIDWVKDKKATTTLNDINGNAPDYSSSSLIQYIKFTVGPTTTKHICKNDL